MHNTSQLLSHCWNLVCTVVSDVYASTRTTGIVWRHIFEDNKQSGWGVGPAIMLDDLAQAEDGAGKARVLVTRTSGRGCGNRMKTFGRNSPHTKSRTLILTHVYLGVGGPL